MKTTARTAAAVTRNIRPTGAIAALLTACLALGAAGCEEKFDEFRSAAGPQLESGVNALLDGLVSGVFAAVNPTDTTTP
jgi:hypothetical protein